MNKLGRVVYVILKSGHIMTMAEAADVVRSVFHYFADSQDSAANIPIMEDAVVEEKAS